MEDQWKKMSQGTLDGNGMDGSRQDDGSIADGNMDEGIPLGATRSSYKTIFQLKNTSRSPDTKMPLEGCNGIYINRVLEASC